MSPVAYLRTLSPREYATLLLVTGMLTCSLGFAGAAVLIVYGPQQGTGTVPGVPVTAGHLTRGSP